MADRCGVNEPPQLCMPISGGIQLPPKTSCIDKPFPILAYGIRRSIDQFVKHVPLSGGDSRPRRSPGGFRPRSCENWCRPPPPRSPRSSGCRNRWPRNAGPTGRSASPCVTQLAWRLAKVVEIQPADGQRLEILECPGLRQLGQGRVARLKRPADEGGEAVRLVLQLAQSFQVFDPVGQASRRGRTSWWPSRVRPARATCGRLPASGRPRSCTG